MMVSLARSATCSAHDQQRIQSFAMGVENVQSTKHSSQLASVSVATLARIAPFLVLEQLVT